VAQIGLGSARGPESERHYARTVGTQHGPLTEQRRTVALRSHLDRRLAGERPANETVRAVAIARAAPADSTQRGTRAACVVVVDLAVAVGPDALRAIAARLPGSERAVDVAALGGLADDDIFAGVGRKEARAGFDGRGGGPGAWSAQTAKADWLVARRALGDAGVAELKREWGARVESVAVSRGPVGTRPVGARGTGSARGGPRTGGEGEQEQEDTRVIGHCNRFRLTTNEPEQSLWHIAAAPEKLRYK